MRRIAAHIFVVVLLATSPAAMPQAWASPPGSRLLTEVDAFLAAERAVLTEVAVLDEVIAAPSEHSLAAELVGRGWTAADADVLAHFVVSLGHADAVEALTGAALETDRVDHHFADDGSVEVSLGTVETLRVTWRRETYQPVAMAFRIGRREVEAVPSWDGDQSAALRALEIVVDGRTWVRASYAPAD